MSQLLFSQKITSHRATASLLNIVLIAEMSDRLNYKLGNKLVSFLAFSTVAVTLGSKKEIWTQRSGSKGMPTKTELTLSHSSPFPDMQTL